MLQLQADWIFFFMTVFTEIQFTYSKIHSKGIIHWVLVCSELCNHHDINFRTLHHPSKKVPSSHSLCLFLPHPQPPGSHQLTLCLYRFARTLWTFHISGEIQYNTTAFCVRPLSRGIVFARFIHAAERSAHHSFLPPRDMPRHGYTAFCPPNHPL